MFLKLHSLHSHLNVFSENMGDFNEEHRENIHQVDISTVERRYQGNRDCNLMGDYLLGLVRELSHHVVDEKYKKTTPQNAHPNQHNCSFVICSLRC